MYSFSNYAVAPRLREEGGSPPSRRSDFRITKGSEGNKGFCDYDKIYNSSKLMTDCHRNINRFLRPRVPVVNVNISSADRGVGAGTLLLNTSVENTAVGAGALLSNSTGEDNNAVGAFALFNNVEGFFNNAFGHSALQNNLGFQNNAMGDESMINNTSGSFNTAIGDDALHACTEGSSNVAIGDEAGNNLTTGDQNIYIGKGVSAGADNELRFIRIGDTSLTDHDCFIAGIVDRAVDTGTAQLVFADGNQKLGTILVDANGNSVPFKPQAMLDEALKQQKRIAELEATVERQQKGMEVLTAQLKEQAAQIQKVSAQVEMSKPAARTVANK